MEKVINNFDNKYSASTDGTIYSHKGKKKELIGKVSRSGYRTILITHNNKRKYLLAHRIIAEVFILNPLNKRTVNHKDGNKLNNNIDNLEWATDSENLIHARDNGMISKCKINMIDANEIRRLRAQKVKVKVICDRYNLSRAQVYSITQNKRWKV